MNLTKFYEYLSPLLNAAAFAHFQDDIITKVEELELVYDNSNQKVISLNLIKDKALQVALTEEVSEVGTGKVYKYMLSMQFVEDGIYVDVVDDAFFITFIHLIEEVYTFMEPIIYEMNYILLQIGNIRVDTTYLQSKIASFKNVSDEKKEHIYSLYNIHFI